MPVVPIRDDFPDWGAAPSSLSVTPPAITITAPSDEIATFDMSNYQYGVLVVSRDGTAISNDIAFQWMGPVGNEGSIISQSQFAIEPGGTIVIPFQCLTPTLRIADAGATTYPYDIGVSLTLFTSPPYQHGFPGGIFAINDARTIVMGDVFDFVPDGCGPGEHVWSIGTTSTNYDVTLTIYPRREHPIDIVLVAAGSGSVTNNPITLPATQWVFSVINNDADADFTVMVVRTPNPN